MEYGHEIQKDKVDVSEWVRYTPPCDILIWDPVTWRQVELKRQGIEEAGTCPGVCAMLVPSTLFGSG